MIDEVKVRSADRVIFELHSEPRARTAGNDEAIEVELAVDQHYGIRVVRSGQWTTISFREAGEWSKLEDTRTIIRAALSK